MCVRERDGEGGGHLAKVVSLSTLWTWVSHWGPGTWLQEPLPTEPSRRPCWSFHRHYYLSFEEASYKFCFTERFFLKNSLLKVEFLWKTFFWVHGNRYMGFLLSAISKINYIHLNCDLGVAFHLYSRGLAVPYWFCLSGLCVKTGGEEHVTCPFWRRLPDLCLVSLQCLIEFTSNPGGFLFRECSRS